MAVSLVVAASVSGDWQAALDCKSLSDDADRLACFDRAVSKLARDANVRTRAVKPDPATVTQNQVPKAMPKVAPEQLFGKSDAEVNRSLVREPKVDAISAKVKSVERNSYKKLLLALENDQTWQQIDSERMTLAAGDRVVIERTFSGGFLLRKEQRKRGIRVRRVR